MDKPILFYDVRVQTSRVTGGTLYLPAIVEREEAFFHTNPNPVIC